MYLIGLSLFIIGLVTEVILGILFVKNLRKGIKGLGENPVESVTQTLSNHSSLMIPAGVAGAGVVLGAMLLLIHFLNQATGG
jgi:hypothetical protein